MKTLKHLKHHIHLNNQKNILIPIILIIILISPMKVWSVERNPGEELFIQHCSGCHINGGNIIRRGKTLKLSALKRNEIDDPEKIAKIARNGVGIMSGYEKVLGEGNDQIVANWIWQQAQNAWSQG